MGIVCIKTTTKKELSNEALYVNLPQRVSKLSEVKDLNFRIYLINMDFLGNFNFDFW